MLWKPFCSAWEHFSILNNPSIHKHSAQHALAADAALRRARSVLFSVSVSATMWLPSIVAAPLKRNPLGDHTTDCSALKHHAYFLRTSCVTIPSSHQSFAGNTPMLELFDLDFVLEFTVEIADWLFSLIAPSREIYRTAFLFLFSLSFIGCILLAWFIHKP